MKKIGDSFVEKIKDLGEGQRWWFLMPNPSNPLQRMPLLHDSLLRDPLLISYRLLRSKYLHFSAKCDPVNAPNYNEDSVMCRITYHGDNVELKSSTNGVYFLYELEGKIFMFGNFNEPVPLPYAFLHAATQKHTHMI